MYRINYLGTSSYIVFLVNYIYNFPSLPTQGSSRSGSSSGRPQGPTGGPAGSGRQGGPGSQTDGGPGQRTQLQQQAQSSVSRTGQPGAAGNAGPQQTPGQGQGMGMGMGMGMGPGQAKPGQMGPAGGPMGQARQTGPAGTTPVTMVSIERKTGCKKPYVRNKCSSKEKESKV